MSECVLAVNGGQMENESARAKASRVMSTAQAHKSKRKSNWAEHKRWKRAYHWYTFNLGKCSLTIGSFWSTWKRETNHRKYTSDIHIEQHSDSLFSLRLHTSVCKSSENQVSCFKLIEHRIKIEEESFFNTIVAFIITLYKFYIFA